VKLQEPMLPQQLRIITIFSCEPPGILCGRQCIKAGAEGQSSLLSFILSSYTALMELCLGQSPSEVLVLLLLKACSFSSCGRTASRGGQLL